MVQSIRQYLKQPRWRQQHVWRKAIWNTLSRVGLTGLHLLPLNRRWVEIHRRTMSLEGLDAKFTGFKIVQISDLHYSPVVWARYLGQHVRWVNELEPDLVVVTGDLITGGYRFAHRVATLLSHLKTRHGVVCTLGNHDYGMYGRRHTSETEHRGDYLEKCLKARGLIVLRNAAMEVKMAGARPLVVVGLDDEWSGNLKPQKAFAGLDGRLPIICLNHNPANVLSLMEYPWQWMLSGHTHGRQVAASRFAKTFYPHRYRHYTHGYYAVEGRHLYVNRGISYGQRMLHWCRPEITAFKLCPAKHGEVEKLTPRLALG